MVSVDISPLDSAPYDDGSDSDFDRREFERSRPSLSGGACKCDERGGGRVTEEVRKVNVHFEVIVLRG